MTRQLVLVAFYLLLSIIRWIMKAKYLVFSLSIGLLSLAACYHYAPSKVEYNGKTYKNGWYQYSHKSNKDLHVCGIDYEEDKAPLFNEI